MPPPPRPDEPLPVAPKGFESTMPVATVEPLPKEPSRIESLPKVEPLPKTELHPASTAQSQPLLTQSMPIPIHLLPPSTAASKGVPKPETSAQPSSIAQVPAPVPAPTKSQASDMEGWTKINEPPGNCQYYLA